MEIVLVGLNHRTAPRRGAREGVLQRRAGAPARRMSCAPRGILEETLVLSTCNRSEVYGVPPESSHECAPGLSSFLSEFHAVRPEALSGSLYHHYDREAVRHLFRVFGGTRLDAAWRGGNPGTGARGVPLCARTGSYRPGAEPDVSRCAGSREARADGKRIWGRGPCPWRPRGVKLAERIFGKTGGGAVLWCWERARSASRS